MEICSDGHEEIVYEGRKCPICELLAELNNTIEVQVNKIQELESEIEELKQ